MLARKYLFPNVIEMNFQAGRRLGGINVYLIDGGSEYVLIDVGYKRQTEEILDLIRKMDFKLSDCKMLIASHADADHTQGLARARQVLRTKVAAHPAAAEAIETGDTETTFASIKAQGLSIEMPPCKVDVKLGEGDKVTVGGVTLEVWHTPGHTAGQLAFKMGDLLFCGDNIYKDSSVGVIDAHHGSNIPDFIGSLNRILRDDSKFLLPSHGPVFPRDNRIIQKAIDRLTQYQYLADFGTCNVEWPLDEEWNQQIESGRMPDFSKP
jgi:glyoxylase-like metal-dependent hydrolase (beta-lactamase superfamily II)